MDQPKIRKTDCWNHQLHAYHSVLQKFEEGCRGVMLPLGMGSGKSKVAIDLISNSERQGKILIACPLSVCSVWRREWHKHSVIDTDILVLDNSNWSVAKKAEQSKKLLQRGAGATRIVVINYESIWRPDFEKFVLTNLWDWVICDESHFIKSHSSKVSKFFGKLYNRSIYRLCMTGTPMPHDPIDIYGQYRFLDPIVFGDSWHRFSNTYQTFQYLPGIPQKIPFGHQNMDRFAKKVDWLMVSVPEYSLNLPPVKHDYVTCQLCPKAMRIYNELKNDLIAYIDSGVVIAANALVKVLRLQQITSGYAKEAETDQVEIVDTSKRNALQELIDGIPETEPVVVFCYFKHDLAQVKKVAENLKRNYSELSGEQRDITNHGTMIPGTQIMGVQMKSGGVGIDLTMACYGVYYNTGTVSPGDFDQTSARLDRPGQTRPVTFYHLLAKGTIDFKVYAARKERRDVVEAVMQSIKNPIDIEIEEDVF